jgi:hypothetical protein
MENGLPLTIQGKYLRRRIDLGPYGLCIVGLIRDDHTRYRFELDHFVQGPHFLVTPDIILVFTPEGKAYIGLCMNLVELSSRVGQCVPLPTVDLQEGVCYCTDRTTARRFYDDCLSRYCAVDVDYHPDSSLTYKLMDDIHALAFVLSSCMNPVELRELWPSIALARERLTKDTFYR